MKITSENLAVLTQFAKKKSGYIFLLKAGVFLKRNSFVNEDAAVFFAIIVVLCARSDPNSRSDWLVGFNEFKMAAGVFIRIQDSDP